MLIRSVAFTVLITIAPHVFADKTDFSFDEDDVTGFRRLPLSTLIKETNLSDDNTGFVQLRKNWHDKMIQSTSALNAVKKKEKEKEKTAKNIDIDK